MAGEKGRGHLQQRVWTKVWDPNKQRERGRSENKKTEGEIGSEHLDEADNTQRVCCGGTSCKAAQRRTQDEFGKELSALTEADADIRTQNRNLANKYNLPLSLVENLRDVFRKFDEDNDGTVSGKEILDVFQTVGAIFTRQQCDDVIKSFLGGSISGEIDFEEMIKMFSVRKANAKDYQQDLELAFKMFDLDGDGYVCAEDLKQVMKMLGNDLSDEQIRTIYSHLDTDDNGLIDFREFESILYPDIRQELIVKRKRKRTPHRSKRGTPKAGTPGMPGTTGTSKKPSSKPAGGGVALGAVRGPHTAISGIYNAFYSDTRESLSLNLKRTSRGKSSFNKANNSDAERYAEKQSKDSSAMEEQHNCRRMISGHNGNVSEKVGIPHLRRLEKRMCEK